MVPLTIRVTPETRERIEALGMARRPSVRVSPFAAYLLTLGLSEEERTEAVKGGGVVTAATAKGSARKARAGK